MISKQHIFDKHYDFLAKIGLKGNTFLYLDKFIEKLNPSTSYYSCIRLFQNCGDQSIIFIRNYALKKFHPTKSVLITEYKLFAIDIKYTLCSDTRVVFGKHKQQEFEWSKLTKVVLNDTSYQFLDKNGSILLSVPHEVFSPKEGGWMNLFNDIIASNSGKSDKCNKKQSTGNKSHQDNHKTNCNVPPKTVNTQKDIEKSYEELFDILEDTNQDVSGLKGVNSSFNTIKYSILKRLNAQVEDAKIELTKAMNETIWDNLVIAFFGETNAGKSTIIETFRILFDKNRKKGDGLIVGDGRHDFTKTYEEYKMSIGGHSFTLIDVPGIEGNEDEFKDVIKTALHKAHCVFYVQGHNKKPDVATANKIKKYLGDWVKVYSIYNVRGGAGNYDEEEERETLLTEGVKKTESLIRSEFKKILGDVYAGHITLQGLLAMSANASFSEQREDLINTQRKLLKYFGSADKVLTFSQFKTLTNLVEEKSANFKAEIIESNKQKMISLANKIAKDIATVMEEQKENISNLENRLRTVEREVCNNYLDGAHRNISNKSKNAVDSIYGKMKSDIFQVIDNGGEDVKRKVDSIQQNLLRELKDNIKKICVDELSRATTNSNRKIKELDGIKLKPISLHSSVEIDTSIDFDNALSELDVDFGDVLDWLGKAAGTAAVGATIGSFIPIVGTIVGGVIGAAVGSIAHGASSDGGKADAKKSVSDAINNAKSKAKKDMHMTLSPILSDIESEKKKLKTSAKQELSNINELVDSIDSFDDEIEDYIESLKKHSYGRI